MVAGGLPGVRRRVFCSVQSQTYARKRFSSGFVAAMTYLAHVRARDPGLRARIPRLPAERMRYTFVLTCNTAITS